MDEASDVSIAATPESEKPVLLRLTQIRGRLLDLGPRPNSKPARGSAASASSTSTAFASASASASTEAAAAAAAATELLKRPVDQQTDAANEPHDESVAESAAAATAAAAGVDVMWTEVADLVKQLAALRGISDEASGGHHIETEADMLLDDVVPLFFQSWAAAGKVSHKMFPCYVQLAKILHTTNKLFDTGLFTNQITAKLRSKLAALAQDIDGFTSECIASGECYRQGEGMLRSKMHLCVETLDRLQAELDSISPALHPIHDRLVEIKIELEALLQRKNPHSFSLSEVQILQEEIREIDSARIDGKYIARDGSVVPGQASVIQLLEACFDDVHELLAARDVVAGDNPLRPVYEDLVRIKGKLERLLLVGHWTLKSGDLVPIQIKLGEIDNLRVDGKFMDESGGVPAGQAVLHFLLHKCYRLIYKLQNICEPVSDSLMPVYNQLVTLEKCLTELKKWKVSLCQRELIPYQMKLSGIDKMRTDGKFLDEDGEVPEGQGLLHDLLNNCYDLLRELQLDCRE